MLGFERTALWDHPIRLTRDAPVHRGRRLRGARRARDSGRAHALSCAAVNAALDALIAVIGRLLFYPSTMGTNFAIGRWRRGPRTELRTLVHQAGEAQSERRHR